LPHPHPSPPHHPPSSTYSPPNPPDLHSFPTRRSSDLHARAAVIERPAARAEADESARRHRAERAPRPRHPAACGLRTAVGGGKRSEEHTSELQSRSDLVCRLLLEKKKREARWLHVFAV